MITKDRFDKFTINTKLTAVEKEMLKEPLKKLETDFHNRDLYDVTKPVPYDADEAYECKLARQQNLLGNTKEYLHMSQ